MGKRIDLKDLQQYIDDKGFIVQSSMLEQTDLFDNGSSEVTAILGTCGKFFWDNEKIRSQPMRFDDMY